MAMEEKTITEEQTKLDEVRSTTIVVDTIFSSKIDDIVDLLKPARKSKLEVLKLIYRCVNKRKLVKEIEEIKKKEYLEFDDHDN